jgi:predicted SprT family Zn-dependent metalloprotease
MPRWLINGCIFLLSTAAIWASVQYAVARERVRSVSLNAVYQQLNRESFQGQLPDAEIVWSDLTERKGLTHWMDDGSFKIEIDRATNPSERELLDTVPHEACHIATLPHLEHGDDVHGAAFQQCMTRFNR